MADEETQKSNGGKEPSSDRDVSEGNAELDQGSAGPDPAQEAAEFKDRLLRALAEMENFRRRAEREVSDARTYGIAGFARDLLAVSDSLRSAIDTIGPDLRASAEPGLKAFIEGVELTERELLNVLGKNGIRKLDPVGQRFDPNLQQAMFEIEDASMPAGTVKQVIQDGYTIGERVLRPALVGVSKGGAKAGVASKNDTVEPSVNPQEP